jgi:phage host-nuclease inhibitor protein Gam
MKGRLTTPSPVPSSPSAMPVTHSDLLPTPPAMDPQITQVYLSDPIVSDPQGVAFNQIPPPSPTNQLTYEPRLLARASIGYYDKRLGVDRLDSFLMLLSSTDPEARWENALRLTRDQVRFSNNPSGAAAYQPVPSQFNTFTKIQGLGRSLPNYLLQSFRLKIYAHRDLGVTQRQGEDDRAFTIRLRDAARERRDAEVRKIQDKYESKINKVEDKIRSLQRTLQSDQEEVQARKREEYLGAGETVLGFFIGRRRTTGITTASRRRRMTEKAQSDVQVTQGKLSDLKKDVDELEAELRDAVDKVTRRWDSVPDEVSTIEIKPKRSDIKIDLLALAWVPT